MKIITVMNQKGGIGKTMTAASLAYILGQEHGKKVLLVDADQQGNVSMLYDRFEPEGIGMSELLEKHRSTGGTYSTTELIQTTPYDNVDIIPANGYLMRTNMQLLLNEKEDQIMLQKDSRVHREVCTPGNEAGSHRKDPDGKLHKPGRTEGIYDRCGRGRSRVRGEQGGSRSEHTTDTTTITRHRSRRLYEHTGRNRRRASVRLGDNDGR